MGKRLRQNENQNGLRRRLFPGPQRRHRRRQWDTEGDDFIVALDKQTGRELWRTPRDEATGWSTPLILPPPVPNETITGLLDSKEVVAPPTHQGLQLWLHRTSVFLFVLISAVTGTLFRDFALDPRVGPTTIFYFRIPGFVS